MWSSGREVGSDDPWADPSGGQPGSLCGTWVHTESALGPAFSPVSPTPAGVLAFLPPAPMAQRGGASLGAWLCI